MPTDQSNAIEEARQSATAGVEDQFLGQLADRIGARAGVQAVFGEPVQRGEVTVVPVARVRWGFGGGLGRADDATGGSGSGGGGGVAADPIGYLEIGSGGATFHPIGTAYPSAAVVLASGLAAAIVLRAVARLAARDR